MKRIILLLSLFLGLAATGMKAQNDLDSALVVNEIASEDNDSAEQKHTWTFNNGSTTVTIDSDDADYEDLEEMMESMFQGPILQHFEKFAQKAEKYSWVIPAMGILFGFVLPLLIILIIVYFTYKGRKAKYAAYQKMAESGQTIPQETYNAMEEDDLKIRNDGIRNVFLGIGLAIFLGLIIGKLGLAIGALIGCIGLGKIITWALSRKDDPNKREKE
ncbi:MAG: hypothetical protein J5814_09230 [Bacteroidaceae bacterium]|nr:hypothetical protein [Bacteroidaceae bacterium]